MILWFYLVRREQRNARDVGLFGHQQSWIDIDSASIADDNHATLLPFQYLNIIVQVDVGDHLEHELNAIRIKRLYFLHIVGLFVIEDVVGALLFDQVETARASSRADHTHAMRFGQLSGSDADSARRAMH